MRSRSVVWLAQGAIFLAASAFLGGCVARVGFAAPVPPVAYVAPDPGVGVQVYLAPPVLPVYVQPPCPAPGYLWTPGYWAYAGGYYWVPGTWVLPPRIGVLWTPGYWGFVGGAYVWHAGYWGPHVGFYGGVHYGFGYVGTGFFGGRWVGRTFAYNRTVTNVNVTFVHNVYRQTVIRNEGVSRVSYNGGPHGIAVRPTRAQEFAAREHHFAPTFAQRQHVQEAARHPGLFARANGGHPSIAATPRARMFRGRGVVRARGAAGVRLRSERRAGRNAARPHAERARGRAQARRHQQRRGDRGDRGDRDRGDR